MEHDFAGGLGAGEQVLFSVPSNHACRSQKALSCLAEELGSGLPTLRAIPDGRAPDA
jgi:hypothetical protein